MNAGIITAACAYHRVTKKQAMSVIVASIIRRLNVGRIGDGSVQCETISSELARIRTNGDFRKQMINVGKQLSTVGIDFTQHAELNAQYLLEAFQEISPTFAEYHEASEEATHESEMEGLIDDDVMTTVFTEVGTWLCGDPSDEGSPVTALIDRNPVARLLHAVNTSVKEKPIESLFFELKSKQTS